MESFRLHFEYADGSFDHMDVTDTLENIQSLAQAEVKKRNPVNYWSEEIQ